MTFCYDQCCGQCTGCARWCVYSCQVGMVRAAYEMGEATAAELNKAERQLEFCEGWHQSQVATHGAHFTALDDEERYGPLVGDYDTQPNTPSH